MNVEYGLSVSFRGNDEDFRRVMMKVLIPDMERTLKGTGLRGDVFRDDIKHTVGWRSKAAVPPDQGF